MSISFAPSSSTLHLPRILCMHGGGVTGEIFTIQARSFVAALSPHFRLVFADGPFFCPPGPGMIPVFANLGPFRRWLRWLETHPPIDDESAIDEVEYAMSSAMADDDALGATGEWVGLMGFSQGAKMVATILLEQQLRIDAERAQRGERLHNGPLVSPEELAREDAEEDVVGFAGGKWKFGVVLAGRAPLSSLSDLSSDNDALIKAGELAEGFDFQRAKNNPQLLRLPTLHVHGLTDAGLHLHRNLVDLYCAPGTAKVLEWEGEHRVQVKKVDVDATVAGIFEVAKVRASSSTSFDYC